MEQKQPQQGKGELHAIPCTLTAEEWVCLLNSQQDDLPACCANVGALRDEIYAILCDGAMLAPWNGWNFLRAYRVYRDGHEDDSSLLLKLVSEVAASMGVSLEEVQAMPHQGNGE